MSTSHPSHLHKTPGPRLSPGLLSKIAVLGLALILAACAGMSNASTSGSATPGVTATPTFLSTSGNQLVTVIHQPPVAGAITVNVTEIEFAIIPSITTFHVGVHYYFVVTNKGKQTHAFTFVPTNPDGTPMNEYYQYDHMRVELDTIPPGTTQTINHTFTKADIGHYEMACRMRGHYAAGMHLPAIVVP